MDVLLQRLRQRARDDGIVHAELPVASGAHHDPRRPDSRSRAATASRFSRLAVTTVRAPRQAASACVPLVVVRMMCRPCIRLRVKSSGELPRSNPGNACPPRSPARTAPGIAPSVRTHPPRPPPAARPRALGQRHRDGRSRADHIDHAQRRRAQLVAGIARHCAGE